jgi:plasmid replication initiation protein
MEKLDDLFARLKDKAAGQKLPPEQIRAGQDAPSRLLPDRHPIRDFFIADILDWALKDDVHTMEHPMFSLSKKPDRHARRYQHNDITVTITPSILGLATIWDKDILIYAVSQIMEGINHGRPVSRKVQLTAYDLLVATNRHTGGKNYERLAESFRRLAGTRIETNISTDGQRVRHGFGLLEEWRIVEKDPGGRMVAIELTLSEWLYRAIIGREVLTLNKAYFRLDGGLERRLYELARKHCGGQAKWAIGISLLHKKSGSHATLIKFREMLKRTVLTDCLPDYRLAYDAGTDRALFYTRNAQNPAADLGR